MNRLHLAGEKIHQQILAEIFRRREVGLPLAHGRDALHKLHQSGIRGQHESVDHDAGSFAASDFFQSFVNDQRIDAPTLLRSGECAAFPKRSGNGHHLINKSDAMAVYLEVGSRSSADMTTCSDIDMMSSAVDGQFVHKDGTPYS